MPDTRVSAGWTCPACDRKVPAKVDECRCGYAKSSARGGSETARPAADAAGDDGESPRRQSGTGVLVVVLIALGVVAVSAWVVNRPSADGRAAGPKDQAHVSTPATGAPAKAVAAAATQEPPKAPALADPPSIMPKDPPAVSSVATTSAAPALEDVIGRSLPAVVRVETSNATGSGFFITPDTLLTNVHVVGGNASVTVRRAGGDTVPARVETTAAEIDVAVLKIANPNPGQATLPMGAASRLRAGQEVIALGSPLGVFQNSVTRGIVSAVRQVGELTLVQTDAAINPGNSGGPLIDRAGDVIGITSMSIPSRQGLGFAIGIEHAQALLAGHHMQTTSSATPLVALSHAMATGDAQPSDSDLQRDEGTRTYEQTLAQLARTASGLDDYWQRFRKVCYEGRIVGSFDREWFAVFDPVRAMPGNVPPQCGSYFDDIKTRAREIQQGVLGADEAARKSDVYPGVRRDLRRKYRLDYDAWDR